MAAERKCGRDVFSVELSVLRQFSGFGGANTLDSPETHAGFAFTYGIGPQLAGGACGFALEQDGFCEAFLYAEGVGRRFSTIFLSAQAGINAGAFYSG